MYHPEVYKTTGCDAYRRAGGCRRGDYCAFIHPGDQLVEVSRRAFKREPYGEHSDRSIAEGEAKGSWAEPAPVPGEGGGEPMAIPVPADGAGSEDDCGLGPPSAVAGQQETWYDGALAVQQNPWAAPAPPAVLASKAMGDDQSMPADIVANA